MGRFSNIKRLQCKIKNEIIEKILGNQELLKYIYYDSSNPLGELDIEDTIGLINTYIFKRSRVLETESEVQNYLFVRINSPTGSNKGIFKEIQIFMDIICHNALVDNIDTGEDRSLVILDYLDEMFDTSKSQYWIGELQYQNFQEVFVNNNFSGYRLVYRALI